MLLYIMQAERIWTQYLTEQNRAMSMENRWDCTVTSLQEKWYSFTGKLCELQLIISSHHPHLFSDCSKRIPGMELAL